MGSTLLLVAKMIWSRFGLYQNARSSRDVKVTIRGSLLSLLIRGDAMRGRTELVALGTIAIYCSGILASACFIVPKRYAYQVPLVF
jgi:hypothetical protein